MTNTATTDRNEMQSEVARVLNEDSSTSMGGSLGVSGKAFGVEVTADGYIDTSSSTSASTSDSRTHVRPGDHRAYRGARGAKNNPKAHQPHVAGI